MSRPSKETRPDVCLDQAQHGLRGRRLAAARLADERDELTRSTLKEMPSTASTRARGAEDACPAGRAAIG